jgi:hypothetical protein
MSNNCCSTQYVNGGTWVDITLVTPQLIGATLNNTTLTGGVQLDAATAAGLADQLCSYLETCVQEVVDGGSFSSVTLMQAILNMPTIVNATLSGAVTLDEAAKLTLASALCDSMQGCIQAVIDATLPTDIGAVAAQDGQATNLNVTGGASSDVTFNGGVIQNSTGAGNNLGDTTLSGTTTITGQVPLDTEALAHLCAQLQPCISAAIDAATDINLIAGVFQDCAGAPRAPGVRIPSCEEMNSAIALAMAQLPALDVISSVTYTPDTHTLTVTTTLDDGTTQEWQIDLSSLGGQVLADGVTIGGTGVVGDPLRALLVETVAKPVTTGTAIPTDIHGSRTALLGEPDKWVEFGGYVFPVYNKP